MFTNKHIHITVSFVVISMMMFHMAIPHSHHHHKQEDEVVTHNAEHESHDHHHHHAGDHHHETPPRDKDNTEGSAGLFAPIEKHLHAFHVHEFVPATKIRKTISPIKAFPLAVRTTNNDIKLTAGNERAYRYVLFRPIFYDNPFLVNCSLRAPPYSS